MLNAIAGLNVIENGASLAENKSSSRLITAKEVAKENSFPYIEVASLGAEIKAEFVGFRAFTDTQFPVLLQKIELCLWGAATKQLRRKATVVPCAITWNWRGNLEVRVFAEVASALKYLKTSLKFLTNFSASEFNWSVRARCDCAESRFTCRRRKCRSC